MNRSRERLRLTVFMMIPVLAIALFASVSSVLVGSAIEERSSAPRTGVARIGSDIAVVVVADSQPLPMASNLTRWGTIVPLVSLIPLTLLAWQVSGRIRKVLDTAEASVELADRERQGRLQEVVHELRTPLAVMGTNLELANLNATAAPDAVGYISSARRAIDRMARTIDDLAGHGRLAVEEVGGPVDLGRLADEAVTEHRGAASGRGLHLVSVGDELVRVPEADAIAVRTVVDNFLTNAIRLAPSGSIVSVTRGEHASWAWLAVSDEGPGLAPDFHPLVFERGWRGTHDRVRDAGHGETGLGLTIARQLAEAQGGAVTIVSTEGGGSTFTLWLPLGPDALRAAVVSDDSIHPKFEPWHREVFPAR